MSDTSWSRGLQHTRLFCPSLPPRICSHSCPLSQWYSLIISSSAFPFSFCLQSFLASWSFQMSQLFAWGGRSTGVSASTSVLPMYTQDWNPLGWTGWTSLQSKGLWRVFSNTTVQKHLRYIFYACWLYIYTYLIMYRYFYKYTCTLLFCTSKIMYFL